MGAWAYPVWSFTPKQIESTTLWFSYWHVSTIIVTSLTCGELSYRLCEGKACVLSF